MCKKLTPASVIKRYDDCPPAFKISSVCKLALDGTGSPVGVRGSLPHPFNVKAVQGIRQTVHKAVFCISVKSDISYRSRRWRVWTKIFERVYSVCMQTAQSAAFGVGKIVQAGQNMCRKPTASPSIATSSKSAREYTSGG